MSTAIAIHDETDDAPLGKEEEHKLWPHARRGLLHLVALLKSDSYEFEPTPKLMVACGLTDYAHWKKVHELMRGWLADRGYDLVNKFARDGGYAIAHHPQQTFRELLKSTFRALGHLGSANVRNDKLTTWLNQLRGESALQFMCFKTAMGFLLLNSEHMKAKIREIEKELPELGGIADEVTNIPDKLLARDFGRPKFIDKLPAPTAFDSQVDALERAILATRVR